MYTFTPFVRVKLFFPAMPAPIEVRLSCRDLHTLERETCRYITPDGVVFYSHRQRAGACAAVQASVPEVH